MNSLKVLIIDDEIEIRRLIKLSLTTQNYTVLSAATGKEGIESVFLDRPDIILLDLGLPDIDGSEVIVRLRSRVDIPIIVLSARDQEEAKIAALDSGANDYLTKPFGVGELLARIRVCNRTYLRSDDEEVLQLGDLSINLLHCQVFLRGQEIRLTPIQYDLLKTLAQNAGKILTHRQILKKVWGVESNDLQYIRVYIGQLRQKIEENPARPKFIITEPGIGYRMMFENAT
ncbi:response regulator [Pectinatus frisingensis]|uniref:response regulator n=1 Tax=Pectinatus frisingensis TaxID=865 RepID=UPI0018C49936|nr:response regulator [Pectinatus frisingensis]